MPEWDPPIYDENGREDLRSEWYGEHSNRLGAGVFGPPRIYWVGMVLSAIWLVSYLIIYPSIPMVTSHGYWQGTGMPGGCQPWTAICEMQKAIDELNEMPMPNSAHLRYTSESESKIALNTELCNLEQQSIYFNSDVLTIQPKYDESIKRQAEFIKNHKNDIVTLTGNTDERGGAESSLALGLLYAHAVEKRLIKLGVNAKQIRTVSLGKEKPRALCHERKCWKENRRVDFCHVLYLETKD